MNKKKGKKERDLKEEEGIWAEMERNESVKKEKERYIYVAFFLFSFSK